MNYVATLRPCVVNHNLCGLRSGSGRHNGQNDDDRIVNLAVVRFVRGIYFHSWVVYFIPKALDSGDIVKAIEYSSR